MSGREIKLSAPVAQYLLALVLDENIRSEAMDKYAKPLLAEALFGYDGKFIAPADASQLAVEAFRETIWTDAPPLAAEAIAEIWKEES